MKLESTVKMSENRETLEFIFLLICFVKGILKIKICPPKTVEIDYSVITILGVAILLFC